jgi:hypothetical protein
MPLSAGAGARRAGRRRRWVLLGGALGGVISCGSRTGLDYGPPLPPPPECLVASDCPTYGDFCKPVKCVLFADLADAGLDEDAGVGAGGSGGTGDGSDGGVVHRKKGGKCVDEVPVDCDDNDPCTADECAPETGACHYDYATLDSDGDNYRAPRVGTRPGEPGSCGNDCDDTNKNAHPGGTEVCDGVDNDCNGIVDDEAIFIPLAADPIRVDSDLAPAGPGGLAFSGTVFASVYTGEPKDGTGGFSVFESILKPTGEKVPPGEQQVNLKNGDASGGPIVWIGDRFGMAWQDRRSTVYEMYFAILGEDGGKKFNGDVQLSFGDNQFAVNPSLAWNGNEFIVVWQDDRGGPFDLYGQRVSNAGAVVGENIQLTKAESLGNESPSVAAGTKSVGVAWGLGDALNHLIRFQVYSPDLTQPIGEPLKLTDGNTNAVYPNVVWNKDRYVISWYDTSAKPKAIYAAVVGEDGALMVKAQPITNPGTFRSRYPFMRALGDRLLVVYSDDRDQNDGYELYSRMVSSSLAPIGPEQRLTNAKKESIHPIAAFGPDGNVGILFRDDRDGAQHVWFTRLGCVAGGGGP